MMERMDDGEWDQGFYVGSYYLSRLAQALESGIAPASGVVGDFGLQYLDAPFGLSD